MIRVQVETTPANSPAPCRSTSHGGNYGKPMRLRRVVDWPALDAWEDKACGGCDICDDLRRALAASIDDAAAFRRALAQAEHERDEARHRIAELGGLLAMRGAS